MVTFAKNVTRSFGKVNRRANCMHCVGFAVKNDFIESTEIYPNGSERILRMILRLKQGLVNLISAYVPTFDFSEGSKVAFHGRLKEIIRIISHQEPLLILGDFNARVGADRNSWPTSIGYHVVGKTNTNGSSLLELCSLHHLSIINSFFENS